MAADVIGHDMLDKQPNREQGGPDDADMDIGANEPERQGNQLDDRKDPDTQRGIGHLSSLSMFQPTQDSETEQRTECRDGHRQKHLSYR